jgi:polyphosphate kinase
MDKPAETKSDSPETIDLNDPKYYLNRELSQLDFQWRVLEEAQDDRNPLLERIKFLAIVDSNLSEFFMVRVGGLRLQKDAGVADVSADGMTPARQLVAIRKEALTLMQACRELLKSRLLPALAEAGVKVLNYPEMTARQRETVEAYFDEVIFPVLTPLGVDPGHPFPFISNLSTNLAVLIKDKEGRQHFARVKVPTSLPQLVPVKRSSGGVRRDGTPPHDHVFVWISQLIIANLHKLFPGMEVIEAHPFHVTRNADLEIQDWEAADLLETMEESVRKRRFGEVVRLTVNDHMPAYIRDFLAENLKADSNDVYVVDGPLVLSSLMQLTRIERFDLKDRAFSSALPPALRFSSDVENGAIFTAIRQGDILIHHPYDSFSPVIDFLRAAARDENVLAIKQTLYRTGSNSPVVRALLTASRDYGKQVAVLVELKARFDEESNISWAKMLEQEGVHVTYGLLGLKTHCKIALVVRREGEHIRRYVHLATGNYNHVTAQLYEDFGMFTCDDAIGADATDLFNYLTGYSAKEDYRKLLVAPINLRQRLEELIRQEIERARKGEEARLIFKINHLVDPPMIHLLYEASQAGVKVDLIVRGMCCLRPGIKGVSENIRVLSILGRYLEHSRIYYFLNGGQEKIYMGSADLMQRNLNARVEVLFPVEDEKLIRHLRDVILETYLTDDTQTRIMGPDGVYKRLVPKDGELARPTQEIFMTMSRLRSGDG